LGATGTLHGKVGDLSPFFQKVLGHFQQALPQARFGLLKIEQLIRQLLDQLFQLGNNLLVQFFQKGLLDRRSRLCCTHGDYSERRRLGSKQLATAPYWRFSYVITCSTAAPLATGN